jgi:hypothetical protein
MVNQYTQVPALPVLMILFQGQQREKLTGQQLELSVLLFVIKEILKDLNDNTNYNTR